MIRVVRNPPSPNAIDDYVCAACDRCGAEIAGTRRHGVNDWNEAMVRLAARDYCWVVREKTRFEGRPAVVDRLVCLGCQATAQASVPPDATHPEKP